MLYLGCHLSASGGYAAMCRTARLDRREYLPVLYAQPTRRRGKGHRSGGRAETLVRAQETGELGRSWRTRPIRSIPAQPRRKHANSRCRRLRTTCGGWSFTPGNYYNFHPGSHVGQGVEAGVAWIAAALNKVMFDGQQTTVLLETMSGKGSEVGGRFEELREILDRCERPERLGVCPRHLSRPRRGLRSCQRSRRRADGV